MARLSVAILAILLGGCWGGQFIDMPGRVERMETGQDRVEDTLDSVGTALDRHENLLRGLQAQSGARTEDLVDQLSALTVEMETMLRRLGSSGIASTVVDTVIGGEQVIYDEAYLQYQQRSYPTAADGFMQLLEENPGSPLADDALYFAALCHEGMSLPHRAVEELVALTIMFPESERAPAALSRAAAIYGAHGASSDRERLLTRILEEYPGSEEARLAEAALRD